MTKYDFLKLLFDDGQQTCFTSKPTGTRVKEKPDPGDTFFCINALDPYEDKQPTEDWHADNLPRRADANVVCFRNFLIELDNVPLTEQITQVTNLIPVSSIVYSGNKSYHFIISLEHALPGLEEYKEVAARLHKLIPNADKACRNPSRLSRIPNVLRPDTGRVQTLIKVGTRIPNESFIDKLPKIHYYSNHHEEKGAGVIKINLVDNIVRPDAAIAALNLGGRNAYFFWLGNRMKDAGMTDYEKVKFINLAYSNLEHKEGFTVEEAYLAARIKVRS